VETLQHQLGEYEQTIANMKRELDDYRQNFGEGTWKQDLAEMKELLMQLEQQNGEIMQENTRLCNEMSEMKRKHYQDLNDVTEQTERQKQEARDFMLQDTITLKNIMSEQSDLIKGYEKVISEIRSDFSVQIQEKEGEIIVLKRELEASKAKPQATEARDVERKFLEPEESQRSPKFHTEDDVPFEKDQRERAPGLV
jgi:chromosome segregation ATPase